jgi:hypothetical protein
MFLSNINVGISLDRILCGTESSLPSCPQGGLIFSLLLKKMMIFSCTGTAVVMAIIYSNFDGIAFAFYNSVASASFITLVPNGCNFSLCI